MKAILGKVRVVALAVAIGIAPAGPAHAFDFGEIGMYFAEAAFWLYQKLGWLLPKVEASAQSKALLADVQRYRTESPSMDAQKAVDAWLELYDRAAKIESDEDRAWDAEARTLVGRFSMLASLPPPASWPALREAVTARARRLPGSSSLGLRFLAEHLVGDRAAAAKTLAEIEQAGTGSRGDSLRENAAYVRSEAARLYGTREEVAASFVASLGVRGREAYDDVEVPDLVGLVGEARARMVLSEALTKAVRLHVPEGQQTRALAWRVALEQVEKIPVAQWGLAVSIDAAPLYEALDKRFSGAAAKAAQERGGYDRHKTDADKAYFLYLVLNGRQAEAEKALGTLIGGQALYLPNREIETLRRAGRHEALYVFLHGLLGRRPEMRAWDVYTREAAHTGHSAEALALVDGLLKRKDLAPDVLADLRFRRVNALLAADRVDIGIAELRGLLAAPPKADEKTLQVRGEAAVRLAGLGRVLERRELSDEGLAFARAVIALPAGRDNAWWRSDLLRQVFAEQRKQGRAEEAHKLALAEADRKAAADVATRWGMGGPTTARTALVELVSLHVAAGRFRNATDLLDQSPHWGARDLGVLLTEKDSLGIAVAVSAARALAETGNHAAALALTRALIDALPGHDPAYELLISIDKDAHAHLNAVYAADQFEERPLIWKAVLFVRAGRHLEAESLIKRAIAIDPSDGEEGPNDRMRAYAVLAEVLEAKGAKEQAALFRGAVRAIRISERSDELHRLGLYQRSFAGYRQALGEFSDAYCIQSRLAIRLMEQGRREEALNHYRRAYELMPSSFGRVESHCFGCESVFQGVEQQTLAERVFSSLLAKNPKVPQVHYLLGYLQEERGRYPEAVKRFRESVRLDPDYLNAWKHLNDIGSRFYVEPRERDVVRLRLLELDPRRRHVRYDLDSVGNLGALWKAVDVAHRANRPAGTNLYPLRRSAAALDEAQAKLPEEMRRMHEMPEFSSYSSSSRAVPAPRKALAEHRLVRASVNLMY